MFVWRENKTGLRHLIPSICWEQPTRNLLAKAYRSHTYRLSSKDKVLLSYRLCSKKDAVSDINEFTVNTEVHVKTESGMKIVHGASTAYGAMVSPYLSYPDSRAVKMII